MKYSESKVNYIIQQYKLGINQKQIAKKLNTYNTTIRRILLKNNIKIITSSERWKNMDLDLFENYSDTSIQYWLGAIAADGCLTNNALVFETIDKEWVENLRDFINPKLNVNTSNPKKGKKLYRFSIRCKGLEERLLKYGIIPNKSLIFSCKYPITWHFFRGIFDGDGCVTHSSKISSNKCRVRFQIVSASHVFIKQLEIFLLKEGFTPKITMNSRNRKNTIYNIGLYRQAEILSLFNLLYTEAGNNFLKRKYLKFGSLLEKSKR